MLQQFNYATPLSQFLSLHQNSLQPSQNPIESPTRASGPPPMATATTAAISPTGNTSSSILSPASLYEDNSFLDPRYHCKDNSCSNNKSFTIAAILGLHQDSSRHSRQPNGCHVQLLPGDEDDDDADNDTEDNCRTELSEVMNLSVHSNSVQINGVRVNLNKTFNNVGPGGVGVGLSATSSAGSANECLIVGRHPTAFHSSVSTASSAIQNLQNLQHFQNIQHHVPFNASTSQQTSSGCSSGSLTQQQRATERNNLKHLSGLGGNNSTGASNASGQNNNNNHPANVCKKPGKSKRVRTIFTPEQLERLEAEFERQQYMVGPERLYLAHTLQLTEAQVKVWFQNRRIKWRKHHLEITHQRLAVIKQQQQQLQQQLLHDVDNTLESSSSGPEDTNGANQRSSFRGEPNIPWLSISAMPRSKRRATTDMGPGDDDRHFSKRLRNTNTSRRYSKSDEASSFSQKRCLVWLREYTTPDEPDILGPEGMEKFCEDIGVEPENVVMLVLAYKMQARQMGFFTQSEWLKGLSELQCDSIVKLQNKLDYLRNLLNDQLVFKGIYRYAYDFARDKDQRSMDMETAKAMLQLLLGKHWVLYPQFSQFLEHSKYKVINKDQWCNILEFSRTINTDLSNYDVDGAWPVMLDEFVEWLKASRGETRNS